MSKKYIDIDNAIPIAIQAVVDVVGHGITQIDAVTIADKFEEAPTADVVEVRHGYWKWEKKIEPKAQNRLYCSVCDNECLSKGNYYVYSNYCPECGAKMDGERSNENV